MLKSTIKFILVFVITAALAFGVASAAYLITRRIIEKNSVVTEDSVLTADTMDVAAESPIPTKSPNPEFDYYMVKLEGENLSVYASVDGNEEFLYNKQIYKANLTDNDIKLLTPGVKLKNASALTSFMEDYTS